MTGLCTLDDSVIWEKGGGINKTKDSTFCARTYNGNGCLLEQPCTTECFETVFGYSANCASCFAAIPLCSLQAGCAFICQADGESDECNTCTIPCKANFDECSGLLHPLDIAMKQTAATDASPRTTPAAPINATDDTNWNENSLRDTGESGLVDTAPDVCELQGGGVDVEDVDEFFVVYEIMFFPAVETAWTSDARFLAVIVVAFSGIWPYAKNIILMLAWYLPLTTKQRSTILTLLRRLGKYTLVDVHIVILIMIGLILEINVDGGVPVVINWRRRRKKKKQLLGGPPVRMSRCPIALCQTSHCRMLK